MFTFTKLLATMHSKKRKTVFSIYGSQLHQCWTHKISTVKERSYIANAHLKIIR